MNIKKYSLKPSEAACGTRPDISGPVECVRHLCGHVPGHGVSPIEHVITCSLIVIYWLSKFLFYYFPSPAITLHPVQMPQRYPRRDRRGVGERLSLMWHACSLRTFWKLEVAGKFCCDSGVWSSLLPALPCLLFSLPLVPLDDRRCLTSRPVGRSGSPAVKL